MTTIRKTAAALTMLLASGLVSGATDKWLHIYYPEGRDYQGYDMTQVLDVTFDETTGTMHVNTADGTHTAYASAINHFTIGPNVPALRITTDADTVTEITSKLVYLDATLNFEGRGLQDDFTERVRIRGRGNSTWGYSKKPYRLKFDVKQRMLLPKKAKNFVLLANYIDGAMMRNLVAFKFGETIGMPWINHAVPVDVYLNDLYKGSYMLTEKVGFNNGSVDLPAADEANSIMLELDTNPAKDDELTFESAYYDSDNGYYFPVKVKDPDAPADPTEASAWLNKWIADFDSFMSVVDGGDEAAIFAACDLESLVRYVMVFDLCCNQELDHPKSVYVYKTEGGKWNFGPCWDFDWAFGYQPTYSKGSSGSSWNWGWGWETYPTYENPLLGIGRHDGGNYVDGNSGMFFYKLCNNDTFKNRFKEVWDDFYNNHMDAFWQAFEEYAATLKPSANLQGLSRSQYKSYDNNVTELRTWVENRIEFINSDPNRGLWEDNVFDNIK